MLILSATAAKPFDQSHPAKMSIRQQQIEKLIQRELSVLFQKQGFSIWKSALVTITGAKVTPDLSVVRVYVSIYNAKDKQVILNEISEHKSEIRHQLGRAVSQLKRIPDLEFYLDETLDEVYKMEELFKKIREQDGKTE